MPACTFGGGSAPATGDTSGGGADEGSTSASDEAGSPTGVGMTDDGTNDPDPTDGGTNDPDTTDEAGETDADADADDTTTGTPAEVPVLVFVDAPVYEFGAVALAEPQVRTLMLRNEGAIAVANIEASIDPAFAFASGSFPGTAGTCTDSLEVDATCAVAVIPVPTELGEVSGKLAVTYVGDGVEGSATVELRADIDTGELVTNAGFEACDQSVPADWDDSGAGSWYCDGASDGIQPYAGDFMLIADAGPDDQVFRSRQVVDLAGYVDEIDSGEFVLSLSVWATALDDDDDEYAVSMRYYAPSNELLDSYNSGWQTGNGWTEYTDTRTVPVGTREVRLRLHCIKQSGDQCNAYFDEASLVGSVQ